MLGGLIIGFVIGVVAVIVVVLWLTKASLFPSSDYHMVQRRKEAKDER